MADRPVDAFADDRVQRRAHRQRQAVTEREVRQHQTGQSVDGPDMKAPVEEGDLHRLLGRVDGFPRTGGRRGVVQYGFGHAEEQQGNAVAGGKEHGEPGREAVLRLGVVRAQLDAAPGRHGDADDEHQEKGHREHVEPAEVGRDERQRRAEHFTGQFRVADGSDHQQQRDDHGWDEHGEQNDGLGHFLGGVHGRSASLCEWVMSGMYAAKPPDARTLPLG